MGLSKVRNFRRGPGIFVPRRAIVGERRRVPDFTDSVIPKQFLRCHVFEKFLGQVLGKLA